MDVKAGGRTGVRVSGWLFVCFLNTQMSDQQFVLIDNKVKFATWDHFARDRQISWLHKKPVAPPGFSLPHTEGLGQTAWVFLQLPEGKPLFRSREPLLGCGSQLSPIWQFSECAEALQAVRPWATCGAMVAGPAAGGEPAGEDGAEHKLRVFSSPVSSRSEIFGPHLHYVAATVDAENTLQKRTCAALSSGRKSFC